MQIKQKRIQKRQPRRLIKKTQKMVQETRALSGPRLKPPLKKLLKTLPTKLMQETSQRLIMITNKRWSMS
jgi:hypothetical protein